jgi:hypothetical protein
MTAREVKMSVRTKKTYAWIKPINSSKPMNAGRTNAEA